MLLEIYYLSFTNELLTSHSHPPESIKWQFLRPFQAQQSPLLPALKKKANFIVAFMQTWSKANTWIVFKYLCRPIVTMQTGDVCICIMISINVLTWKSPHELKLHVQIHTTEGQVLNVCEHWNHLEIMRVILVSW